MMTCGSVTYIAVLADAELLAASEGPTLLKTIIFPNGKGSQLR